MLAAPHGFVLFIHLCRVLCQINTTAEYKMGMRCVRFKLLLASSMA